MHGVSSFPAGKALDLLFILVQLDLGGSSLRSSLGSFPTLCPPVPPIPPPRRTEWCLPRVHPHCQHPLVHLCLPPGCRPLAESSHVSVQPGDGAEPKHGRGSETIIEQIRYFQTLRSLTLTDPWQATSNFSPSSPFRFFIHRSLYFLSMSEHVLLVGFADHW